MVEFGQGPVDLTTEAPPKKRRVRKMTGGGPLEIPPEMFPTGIDLMWVSDSILGQPCPEERQKYEINAWEPVSPEMFDARFDGMFMRRGHRGEINVQGMVLMWRPMELTLEARAEERALADAAIQTQERNVERGQIDGVNPGFADTKSAKARANTKVIRTYEPGGQIPT